MIKLNVAEIKKRLVGKTDFHFQVAAKELDLSDDDLRVSGLIQVDGEISNAGDVLLLQAHMRTNIVRACGRCLKEFAADAEADVLEKFFPADADNAEADAFTYDSDVVDITEALREGLLVAEPLQALCDPDCRGLCPVCGKDRNLADCGCDAATVDQRMAVLQKLLKS